MTPTTDRVPATKISACIFTSRLEEIAKCVREHQVVSHVTTLTEKSSETMKVFFRWVLFRGKEETLERSYHFWWGDSWDKNMREPKRSGIWERETKGKRKWWKRSHGGDWRPERYKALHQQKSNSFSLTVDRMELLIVLSKTNFRKRNWNFEQLKGFFLGM